MTDVGSQTQVPGSSTSGRQGGLAKRGQWLAWSVLGGTVLMVLGVVSPWVSTGGDVTGIRYLEYRNNGASLSEAWWTVAVLALLLVTSAILLRRINRAGILLAGFCAYSLWFAVSEVAGEVRDVRGYLRVEGSAHGISNAITRSAPEPISAVEYRYGLLLVGLAFVVVIATAVGALLTDIFGRS